MTRVEHAEALARKAREKAEELALVAKERSAQRAAEAARLAAEKKLERAAKAQSVKQQAAARRAETVVAEAKRRAEERRRYPVGALAHEAGLFVYSNDELRPIFAVLGRAGYLPDLAALLAEMLGDDEDKLARQAEEKMAGNFDVGRSPRYATPEPPVSPVIG